MINYTIREIFPQEVPLLSDFLYEAIFQREGSTLLPRSVIYQPELYAYIENFGKSDDNCLVTECEGKIVGAVWTRIISAEVSGYGNLDDKTPEFAISIYKEYRGQGIGAALLRAMISRLKNQGYERASLAVQKDNYAFELYKKVGFRVIGETVEEYLMVYALNE